MRDHEVCQTTEAAADVARVHFERFYGVDGTIGRLLGEEAAVLAQICAGVNYCAWRYPAVHGEERVHESAELLLVHPVDRARSGRLWQRPRMGGCKGGHSRDALRVLIFVYRRKGVLDSLPL